EQEVYLAVPASFDAAARELTARAAEQAGLSGARLIEEPQAAFYAWLADSDGGWRKAVAVGDVVLVCDVGGGATHLTLVAVGEENGSLVLERKAVGDHILLGGDNMDLTLAHAVRARLAAAGTVLDDWQLRGMVHACREAKERLLAAKAPAEAPLVVLGRSRKVVGGAVRTQLTRQEVESALVDGFFPPATREEGPEATRRVGLQEIGLPYASDPGITRHVAAFVGRHREVAAEGPTAVLFNGGVMHADRFRTRMAEVLASWRRDGASVRVLTGADPDLAVARGAATYGLAPSGPRRRGAWRAPPRRPRARLRRGCGARRTGGAGHGAAGEGAVRRTVRDGGRKRGDAARRRVRARGRRASVVPLLRILGASHG